MSKLFNLKEWLTVVDAARHLSIVFGEEVTEADVLRLSLDGHLRLSVNFVNQAIAREIKWIPRGEYTELMELTRALEGNIEDTQSLVLKSEDRVRPIGGVWDLAMIGAEVLDVEQKYQLMTGGAPVTLQNIDGTFVASHDGQLYQLLTHFDDNPYSNSDEEKKKRIKKPQYHPSNYFPAGGLPDDAVLVVRTKALAEFEAKLSEADDVKDKPLTTSERVSLVKLVIGMAIKGYGYNPNTKKNDSVAEIAKDLASLELPLSDDTIRKYLKQGIEHLPQKPIEM